MQEVPHPSQLPEGWEDEVARIYGVFGWYAAPPEREIKNVLRNRKTGEFIRRRNTPEVMAKAPSPYKKLVRYPAPLHNLVRADGHGMPADVYDRLPEFLDRRPSSGRWNNETMRTILDAQGNPTVPVTIFRPVPQIIDQFMPGDTVVLSPGYARTTAANRPRWKVITGTVPARELFTRSDDDLMRWEWRGRNPFKNGGVVTIQNTRGWR